MRTRLLLSLLALAGASSACRHMRPTASAPPSVDLRTRADSESFLRVIQVEDARPTDAAGVATLTAGLTSTNPTIRGAAARGLGRLERAAEIPRLVPLLADPVPMVRSLAADAIAQAATRGGAPEARLALRTRLRREPDVIVRGALAEAMARLASPSAADVDSAVADLLPLLRDTTSLVGVRGGVRAAFFLVRGNRNMLPRPLADALTPLLGFGASTAGRRPAPTAAQQDSARFVRSLAASMLLARMPDAALVTAVARDPSDLVREKAAVAAGLLADTAVARTLTMQFLRDASPIVRTRAVTVYGRRFRERDGCGVLATAARDRDATVALTAIDAMAMCRDAASVALLDSLAAALPAAATTREWHRAAHALVALPVTGERTARPRLATFAAHGSFFVRTYAATAARRVADTATLYRLARDTHPNVVSAALDGLSALVGHGADSVYIEALRATDSQQLMSATRALRATTDGRTIGALLASLDQLTALRRETSRDGRVALMTRIRELGRAADAERLRRYVADFDPAVADSAAAAIGAWTGTRPVPAPARLAPLPFPSMQELAELSRARVVITMDDGAAIEVQLFPFDAPTNAARFARLARSGYFDGLTFHRVAPLFVVQGGSRNANEYFGDASFTRDEVGRENLRGTIGLSTRGRDTGDGQLYFNVLDNLSLDHNYTVYGTVVSGFEFVDRMQEGARITRVVIR